MYYLYYLYYLQSTNKQAMYNKPTKEEAMSFVPFRIHSYTKRELSQLYFPDSSPRQSVQRLSRWISTCAPLAAELKASGYTPKQHHFLANQVRILVKHMGEP
jgi:hypothetical protein